MGVLFINLAATLDTEKNDTDTDGKTADMEFLRIFWNLEHFATYLLMQELWYITFCRT